MLQHSGSVEIAKTGGIYKIDTFKGQSGSPVVLKNNYKILIGIHKGYDPKLKQNCCCLVRPQMIAQLSQWTKELNIKN